MIEQALDAGVIHFDTCARGREAVLPSVLLAAIGGAGGDQASDEGAVIVQSFSILTLAISRLPTLSFALDFKCSP
jgi:hypothetical protein|eukprot:COSAG02_NODE_252_length_26996_cov_29.825607_15_plen_75_part_00